MSAPELSVVCKSCGAEVSPYVTECPYCGTRLRKRAPQLERRDGELAAKETRQTRRDRKRREAAAVRAERVLGEAGRPYATIIALLAPAVLFVLIQAAALNILDAGAIVTGLGAADPSSEPWRYLAAPWVYDDAGYIFCVGLAIAIFVPGLERRLGSVPSALLLLACGALGMLAAGALTEALDDSLIAAGGNGVALGAVAAWAALRWGESKGDPTDEVDWIGAAVVAAVLLLLPLVEDLADPIVGVGGALVGVAAGFAAGAVRRH